MKKAFLFLLGIIINFSIFAQFGVRGGRVSFSTTPSPTSGAFTFTLADSANTSAGVYNAAGQMVRHLWDGVRYSGGSHTEYWDGKDDYNTTISSPSPTYQIKIVSNNIVADWKSVIGNTSQYDTGANIWKGYYYCMTGMAISGTKGYACSGFGEGHPNGVAFDLSNPQFPLNIWPVRYTTPEINFVATDGTRVYWAGFDAGTPANSFVHATANSNDATVQFTTDTIQYRLATYNTLWYGISFRSNSSFPSGLAVQKTGNFLFVAYSNKNQLAVLNKTTGALLQTLSYTNPRGLSVDTSGKLWMITGTNTIGRYTPNVDGTLPAASVSITGTTAPLSTAVSADNVTVVVTDGGNQQIIKAYVNATGVADWAYGTAGGYQTSSTVSNLKFAFTQVKPIPPPFVCFQPNGDFWVGDIGNSRAQKFNSSRVYQTRIASMPATYFTGVDRNSITRVFANWLEYEFNYQPLSGTSGWALKANWGATIPIGYDYFEDPTTLSNSRTYAFLRNGADKECAELVAGGIPRFTGLTYHVTRMAANGDLDQSDGTFLGGNVAMYRYKLLGFSSNNPVWDGGRRISLIKNYDSTMPGNAGGLVNNVVTSDSLAIYFAYDTYMEGGYLVTGYSMGAMNLYDSVFRWQQDRRTHQNYFGEYPGLGWFDIGNQVGNSSGSNITIVGKSIFSSYHGEFWKASQVNKWNMYFSNGLGGLQFGRTGVFYPPTQYSPPGLAGNALSPMGVQTADTIYIFAGDESAHAGIQVWKVTGMETVDTTNITINFPSGYTPPVLGYTRLMAGLPFNDTLAASIANWTRSPTFQGSEFYAGTSVLKYEKYTPPDVYVTFSGSGTSVKTVERNLGTISSTNWTIAGYILIQGLPNTNSTTGQFVEVVDASNKVISKINLDIVFGSPNVTSMMVNDEIIASATPDAADYYSPVFYLSPISFHYNGTNLTFQYVNEPPVTVGAYDPTSNADAPKKLRMRLVGPGVGQPVYTRTLGLKDWTLTVN